MAIKIEVTVTVKKDKVFTSPDEVCKEFLKDVYGSADTFTAKAVKITFSGVIITTPEHEYYPSGTIEIKHGAILGVTHKVRDGVQEHTLSLNDLADPDKYTLVNDVSTDACPVCGGVLESKGDAMCKKCYLKEHYKIHNYSHKPTPKFVHVGTTTPKFYYGLEIEVAVDKKLEWARFSEKFGEKVYFKSDASISSGAEGGHENVSHPHSFEALMDKGSFIHHLPTTGRGEGCHVHVSRTAFDSDMHFSLWYFTMLKSNTLLDKVARRTENSYCKRSLFGDIATKDNKKKGHSRGVAINECNDDTVEVRIFNWSVDPKVLRSYVQFIDSMIEYTRTKTRTTTVTAWKSYVMGLAKYADIAEVVKDMSFPLSTVSRVTPTYREIMVKNLTPVQIAKGAFITSNGTTFRVKGFVGFSSSGEDVIIKLEDYGNHHTAPTTLIKIRTN